MVPLLSSPWVVEAAATLSCLAYKARLQQETGLLLPVKFYEENTHEI